MEDNENNICESADIRENESRQSEITYSPEKDFYKGMGGELRFKAEGLFKKAKEKGISIEDISVTTLKENSVEFPGIGVVELPAYFVKVKGKDIQNGQMMVDGKQIDYYNRYQNYAADKIEKKNYLRDDNGRIIRENNRPKIKHELELFLTDWERFEVGKSLVDDKEFGMEKTITGACDRVIRKLMGENDWLYPEEARMLDEEFSTVQESIAREQESRRQPVPAAQKKATERQINYLKARIKNAGLDADNDAIIEEILKQNGFGAKSASDLSTSEMSRVIDSITGVIPKVKEVLSRQGYNPGTEGNPKIH